jgi:hypothetical protein
VRNSQKASIVANGIDPTFLQHRRHFEQHLLGAWNTRLCCSSEEREALRVRFALCLPKIMRLACCTAPRANMILHRCRPYETANDSKFHRGIRHKADSKVRRGEMTSCADGGSELRMIQSAACPMATRIRPAMIVVVIPYCGNKWQTLSWST